MALSEKTISTACIISKSLDIGYDKENNYDITITNLKEETSAEDMDIISDAIDELTMGSSSSTTRKQVKELIG